MDEQMTIDDAVNVASVLSDFLTHHADDALSTRPDAVSTDLRRLAGYAVRVQHARQRTCAVCAVSTLSVFGRAWWPSISSRGALRLAFTKKWLTGAPIARTEARAGVTQFTRRPTR